MRIDTARGMCRFYEMAVAPSLFGEWALVREWGRVGSPGRVSMAYHASEAAALDALEAARAVKVRRGYRIVPEQAALRLWD